MINNILITGGLGYIGSHTVIELINAGYNTIIIDNLSNSDKKVLSKIEKITGKEPVFYPVDINSREALNLVFSAHKIDAVIHFAALKAVGESVIKPLLYYRNNVAGSMLLLQMMMEYNVKNIVFSSSATVYGSPDSVPVQENARINPASPYGWSKVMIEQVLKDIYSVDNSWNIAILRYFNPVGAHKSGLIGENPNGIPNNLMPYITQVAINKLEYLEIFGNDYPTHDGTGVRDYIHVVDLAIGHIRALEYFTTNPNELSVVNLGTGVGYSVFDIVKAFEKASGEKIPYKIIKRRYGDVAEYYADVSLAKTLYNWQTQYSIFDMCKDSWNWQKNNPDGY
ncbi:MAG: UDP-glucose 4-epimerase GalE [Neisseriaceae bacterium]